MPSKQSQQNDKATEGSAVSPRPRGRLYIVAVPIGHPEDITIRAIRVLSAVDLIASEQPKATQHLLTYHSIHTTVTSYGPMNLSEKVQILIHRLQQGTDIALVSDCGSPLVVDPGKLLVETAHAQGISVIAVPGPSALIAAITVSGLVGDSFSFYGRLPTVPSSMTRVLTTSLRSAVPIISFCTYAVATRAVHVLARIAPRRLVALACDLTTPNERIIRGMPRLVRDRLRSTAGQDVTLIIAGKQGTTGLRPKRSTQSLSSRRINTR